LGIKGLISGALEGGAYAWGTGEPVGMSKRSVPLEIKGGIGELASIVAKLLVGNVGKLVAVVVGVVVV